MQLQDIQRLLDKINGCTFAGLDCTTVVDLRGGKKNPMRGRVRKVTIGNRVMLFTNKKSSGYDNMVKRRLQQEGKNPDTFVLGELKWGNRLPNSPVIRHIKDGRECFYLQCIFLEAGAVKYFLDDQQIAKDDVEGLAPESSSSKQGLTNEVIVRSYKLESIDAIRIMGEEIIDIEPPQIMVTARGISG